ncbi:MAG TPA: multidrug efflux RND transporter permease subunit [Candidatus Paceibacterota bacterium]|nr:multidrug efflux RND transporter permease subunit [Verrucomicrobiota bacterium]HOX02474.1 multidrug efflux RND transporter permease subunit [Verrucomicrobiota bacterium]HRZ44908.1 multidrug efflux RND transporter permease subunit [Candidatus Paceibacterota bacterium]HRZ93000.1 multidrug efflux RND transporter permease subunit [Candidatus Paceibacterota bacterium]
MFAKFFIERPVLANVIAIVIMLLGGVAVFTLPVAQYPPITPPTVQVTATYPGASAKTLVETVALPIEQQVNGVERMIYMQSTCTPDGRYTLTVTFEVGTDLDFAQVLVQNRVAAAMSQLPAPVQQQGVVTKKKSTAILQIITLTSTNPVHDALFLSNFGTLELRDKLARLPGVGDVLVFGIGEYSMRIWLDPEQMSQRSLTPKDIIGAIQRQNAKVTAGQIGMPPAPAGQDFQLAVEVQGALSDPAEFERIIVQSSSEGGGQLTRIQDIGRVEMGARTYSQFFELNGKPAGGIAIYQLPEANALETADVVEAAMERYSERFPAGLTYSIPLDTTIFVRESVNEVYHTLFEAGVLVLLVIMVFLQDWRATLVPATTVPVTIVGAFAGMAALGFTVNLLTLFAIVLAIGIVVDDAIVVVEGAAKHIEHGRTPKQASIDAMSELFGPIIGITLVLMSVFLPPAFMPGITGQMYRQFALVIAVTAVISAVNAATLKPTQCALWLRPHDPARRKNFFFRWFNSVYEPTERAYVRVVRLMVKHSGVMVAVALGLVALAGWGLTKIPTGFIPTEDQGYVLVAVQLPDGASLERTERVMDRITQIVIETPGVENAITIGGISALDNSASLANAGMVYVLLEEWGKRGPGKDLRSIHAGLTKRLGEIGEASALVLIPPPIQGLGLSGGFQMQLELTDGSYDFARLQESADALVAAARDRPEIQAAFTPFRAQVPQITVTVDRSQAETLDVAVGEVFDTLQSYLGSTYVNLFTKFGHNFMVFAQADAKRRMAAEDIRRFHVRSQGGNMIPLGTLADIRPAHGPALISLYNLFPTATINGSAAASFSSGQGLEAMQAVAEQTLGPGLDYEWTAMSYQEKLVGNSTYFIFGLAIVLVYFVLAAQYESWIIPAAVILAVPLALLGTVGALLAVGLANNIYVQIGLVLLIALSAKNAILIVEMAREGRAAGKGILEATVDAAQVRFRPILMTSFVFILGVMPLVLASGAGASARKSLGIAVSSGMLASTCLAVLFVPSFYVVLQRWVERKGPPLDSPPEKGQS